MFWIPKSVKKTYQNHTPKRCQNHIKKDPNFKMHFKVCMQIPNLNRDRVICENRAPMQGESTIFKKCIFSTNTKTRTNRYRLTNKKRHENLSNN